MASMSMATGWRPSGLRVRSHSRARCRGSMLGEEESERQQLVVQA
jgi:hypothetical protein